MHDIEATLHPVAGDHIPERICLCMTHVQVTRRVRKHVEYVLLGSVIGGITGAEWGELIPHREPTLLDRLGVVVLVGHAHPS